MTRLLSLKCHEFGAHWNFVYNPDSEQDPRLRPFWAFEHINREHGGAKRLTLEHNGREIAAQFYHNDECGIDSLNHPSEDVETIREFHIDWHWRDDPERDNPFGGHFVISPRHTEATDEDGNVIGSNWPITGVNVHVQGSNLDFREYLPLFRKIVTKLGISRRYWRDEWLHESSNIYDAERYVRLEGEKSGPLHAVDGPIARIANLLSDDRSGYRKHVADDRDTAGQYHTATIGRKRARELIKLHTLPKEIKHYYGKNPEAVSDDHPIAYPKLGASYQTSLDPETLYWNQLDRLYRELDESVLNVLQWAGLPVTADELKADTDDRYAATGDDPDDSEGQYGRLTDAPGPYVDDAYHRIEFRHRQLRLVDNPLPEIETEQECTVIRALSDGLEDSDLDTLEALVTDGGEISPQDVADETGWHLDTVYRVIDRLEDLVEHSYGELSLRSHHVAQRVLEAVQAARESAVDAIEIAGKALDDSDRLAAASDGLTQWFDSHGVEIQDRTEGRMRLRFNRCPWDSKDDAVVSLLTLLHQWMKAGFKREKLLNAEIVGLRELKLDGRTFDSAVH